jgi:sulfur relay (sulfurtransferase) DsrC/TusE family protein
MKIYVVVHTSNVGVQMQEEVIAVTNQHDKALIFARRYRDAWNAAVEYECPDYDEVVIKTYIRDEYRVIGCNKEYGVETDYSDEDYGENIEHVYRLYPDAPRNKQRLEPVK